MAQELHHRSQSPAKPESICLLVIEDSPADTELILLALRNGAPEAQFECTTCDTLKKAESLLAQETFHLILSDLHLPDSSGADTYKALLRHPKKIPLIILSGGWNDAMGQDAVREGAQDYIPKDTLPSPSIVKSILYALFRARLTKVREEHALELAKQRSALMARISHEIRTPMNGVIGMTSLLLGMPLSAEARECVETIRTSGEALLGIVNEVLDFSKLEAGKIQLEPTHFETGSFLNETIQLFRFQVTQKGLSLRLEVDPNFPKVLFADPTRIRQCLVNFLGNAIKFTEAGSVILKAKCLSQSENKVIVRFEVEDTGIGVKPEDLSQLFIPFSQVGRETVRRYGGTGLGLSITREIVTLMGGQAGVEPQKEGSCFWFEIPVELGSSDALVSTRNVNVERTMRFHEHARLLVVDDSAVNQKVAVQMIERLGMKADAVSNGHEAVETMKRNTYSAILMDCFMPDMDGYEATRRIRLLPHGEHIPILGVTATVVAEDLARCLESGMNAYLVKPFTMEQLAAALGEWVGWKGGPAGVSGSSYTPPSPDVRLNEHTLQQLRSLTKPGEKDFLQDLIEVFVDSAPKALEALEAAYADRNPDRVKRMAHKLKGLAANLGAERLVHMCEELEIAGTKGDISFKESGLTNLENEFGEVRGELEKQWKQHTPLH
jgi:two-component system, sensor histidine kinase and response regulator